MFFSRTFYPRTGFDGGLGGAGVSFRDLHNLLGGFLQTQPAMLTLRLTEEKDRFVLEALAPGIPTDSLKLTLQGKTLYLEGERLAPQLQEGSRYHRQERSFGAFSRAITLPAEVDVSAVKARQDNGILYVELPKDKVALPREIKIG
jgi:HSP20 family protein